MIDELNSLKEYIDKNNKKYGKHIDQIIVYAGKKKKAVFTAAFLTESGKETLREWWAAHVQTPFLQNKYMEHMTIKYRPDPEEVTSISIGEEVSLKVIGYAEDEMGQAVLISTLSGVHRAHSGLDHITVSTGFHPNSEELSLEGAPKPVRPAYSKELLSSEDNVNLTPDGPTLTARIGFSDSSKNIRYDFDGTIYDTEEINFGD